MMPFTLDRSDQRIKQTFRVTDVDIKLGLNGIS
jgi:hypothetical protein